MEIGRRLGNPAVPEEIERRGPCWAGFGVVIAEERGDWG